MRPSWLKVTLMLAALWGVVGGIMWAVKWTQPTPERIAGFVQANPLDGRSEKERAEVIGKVATMVNGLDYDRRNEMNRQRKLEDFWKSMTAAERGKYLELVLPTGFRQMMENFNKMEPQKRKRMVDRAVRDLRERGGEEPPPDLEPQQMKRIVDEGLKAFYSEATIEAKMDALPFLEELERTIKWSR